MNDNTKRIREGDIYDIISVDGISFEIRYGYNAEFEKECWEPIPIFPDLKNNPIYTQIGEPVVTQMQSICEDYQRKPNHTDDESCADCVHFHTEERKLIGVCKCQRRKIKSDTE